MFPSCQGLKRPWQTRTHCCGHIVADTNVSPFARPGNICCGHKFCVRDTKNVSELVKGPEKRDDIVADTLLLMMFLVLRKLGNICCGHKMFLNKIRNIFCVPDTKFVSATNVARVGKRGTICVGNNVSATMCPRLPGP